MDITYYVGIDFSLNSPSLCIFNSTEYEFISFSNYEKDSLIKKKIPKALEIHKELLDNKYADIYLYDRRRKNDDYAIDQFQKIQDATNLANDIINILTKKVNNSKNINIAIEGFSYGSKGNAFIDLIIFNSFLRSKLYDNFGNNISVFSPSAIKMHAGKGNANKLMMYEYFKKNVLKDIILGQSLFWKWLTNNDNKCVNAKKDIVKPIDDLVDAYFICKYLYDIRK